LAPESTSVAADAAGVHTSIIGIRQLGEELVAKNVDIIKKGKQGITDRLLMIL
jgi:hypothetical protein